MATLNHNDDNQTKPKKTKNWFLGCFGFSGEKKKAKTAGDVAGRKKHFRLTWPKFRNLKKSAENTLFQGKSSSKKVQTQRCRKYGGVIVKANQTLPITQVVRAVQFQSKEVSNMNIELESRPHLCETVDKQLKQLVNRNGNKQDQPAGSGGSNKPDAGLVKKSRTEVKKTLRDGGDTMIGLSIFMVWLMIMLIWGRLCAILCTTVGFYCMPHLTKKTYQSNTNKDLNTNIWSPASDLELYMKKGILKGFFSAKI